MNFEEPKPLKSAKEIAMEKTEKISTKPADNKKETLEPLKSSKDLAVEGKSELLKKYREKEDEERYEMTKKEERELDRDFIRETHPVLIMERDGKKEEYRIKAIHNGACWMEKVNKSPDDEELIFGFANKDVMKENPRFYSEDVKSKVNEIKRETNADKIKESIKSEYTKFLHHLKEKGHNLNNLDEIYSIKHELPDEDREFWNNTFAIR